MVNILLNFSDFFHSKPPFHIIIGKCQLSCGDMRQVKMRYKLRKNVVELDNVFFRQLQPKSEKKTLRLTSKKKNLKKFLKIGHGSELRRSPLLLRQASSPHHQIGFGFVSDGVFAKVKKSTNTETAILSNFGPGI